MIVPTPPPPPLVLSGHAASLTPYCFISKNFCDRYYSDPRAAAEMAAARIEPAVWDLGWLAAAAAALKVALCVRPARSGAVRSEKGAVAREGVR